MTPLFHRIAEKVRRGEPIPTPLAALLAALTPITRHGIRRRLRRSRVKVDAHVISFGNLTAGGTGKTPAVIERAQREVAAGHRVAVITRGYGSARTREPHAVTSADEPCAVCRQVGDEPALILRRVPEVVVVKSADRVAGARAAIRDHGCDTLILDDAFQAVRLARDENILVVDATNPFGNGHLVPRGILREPVEGAARATHIILTRCDQVDKTDSVDQLVLRLRALCPGAPIRKTRHAPQRLWRVATGEELPLSMLQHAPVTAASAIGNPEAFHRTLAWLGAKVVETRAARDHANLSPEQLGGGHICVVTEKDAVRMTCVPGNVLALGIGLEEL